MTPKKAWDTILKIQVKDNGVWTPTVKWMIEDSEAFPIIDNIIAKATQMKPIVEIDEDLKLKGYSKLEYTDYRCPRCKKYIGYRHYFCPEKDCGQKLDWSDMK